MNDWKIGEIRRIPDHDFVFFGWAKMECAMGRMVMEHDLGTCEFVAKRITKRSKTLNDDAP